MVVQGDGRYLTQDPLPRPTGTMPNAARTPYPPFTNQGTSQPKFDARVDYEIEGGGTLSGVGWRGGHRRHHPQRHRPVRHRQLVASRYFNTRWSRGGSRVAFFTNLLNGDASNLLAVGPNRRPSTWRSTPRRSTSRRATCARSRRATSSATVATTGTTTSTSRSRPREGSRRRRAVPAGRNLPERSLPLGRRGRVDKFSSIRDAVFSPRTTL